MLHSLEFVPSVSKVYEFGLFVTKSGAEDGKYWLNYQCTVKGV